ncbi:hypothetical protein DICPUDRAFT_151830 [Dictyostelium purpureum]|uniref:very-long-chain (3R)-3-hydroxyacyl-CoA dehydratase n=1 Tax=Dictyostelium purpureum TaxID=5786 RepID=F0ZJV2_DICPU|nr:uncharacterized protein DICPUDRAFT_151830 [Dictyostelium purpureum]EGC35788.1 hypothetical protein DICPUDRAFT_151830 [Dictyostelium purpureum]|eukprot:XP_003287682.1 hypothetical protein DICPUDRAFT_151830 [Dictyostelium purpureum]
MSVKNVYLVAYNVIQTIGWSYILFLLSVHLFETKSPIGVWEKVGDLVRIFQYAAVLEIVHSALGLVRTSAVTTFIQVFSRVACVFLADNIPSTQNHFFLSLMLMSWSITEVIRYSFYALSILKIDLYFLGWLRYTTFIVLYPTGVTGETGTIWNSLEFVKRTGFLTLSLPNSLNFGFDFYTALICSLGFYVVGLPYLYTYMLGQRKKFIASNKKQKTN